MKPLTIDNKVAILLECAYGVTQRQVAKNAGTTEATVSRVVRRWEKEHTVLPMPKPGRPPKFTDRDIRHVVRTIHKNRRVCLKEITDTVPDMSVTSARKIVHREGYN
jgi:transposase